ncbi:PPOX class F420-dependent oxidoreductase [Micromonospora musae]|uniref:PPOX class F420-dependent oxidoreductase n=1 Tax=Micromonospora musae TaxID=1894970 RepID=A0A3A9YAT8_9ACTN|nr:PPOX class F420-dependent oxidoreductase [Micromonospora musae]RKN22180.1 PPOX class F420-dependent oxidoreductase [Micromonospora musae]RKN33943.1 PPOX class F420-dependent oxidoreductase [Micromonospora musae]
MSVPAEIAHTRYATVTTYRRDGRPVPTPVGLVADAGELFVLTQRKSGKVRRIRNNATVTVTPCDPNGRVAAGAPTVRGQARLLDRTETARVRRLMARRYPIARLVFGFDLLLGRRDRRIGIAIRL